MKLRRALVLAAATASVAATAATGGIAMASSHTPGQHIDYGRGKMPCGVSTKGLPYPPGSGTMAYETTCTIRWRVSVPASNGTRMVLIDPAGHFTVWRIRMDYSH